MLAALLWGDAPRASGHAPGDSLASAEGLKDINAIAPELPILQAAWAPAFINDGIADQQEAGEAATPHTDDAMKTTAAATLEDEPEVGLRLGERDPHAAEVVASERVAQDAVVSVESSSVRKRPAQDGREAEIEYDPEDGPEDGHHRAPEPVLVPPSRTQAQPASYSTSLGISEATTTSSSHSASSLASALLTGTSTVILTHSGVTSTSLALVTYDPAHTKIQRCIYGCDTITIHPTGTVTTTSTVTVVPVTLPCSLVICPSCGCTTRTISVTGCPVITTSTPPNSTVTVKADVTVTFFTVTTTTTVTTCIPSTCIPTYVTVGETETGATTLTLFSTQKIYVTPTTSSSSTSEPPPGPPLTTIDPGCPCGYNEIEEVVDDRICSAGSLVPPDCPCQPTQAAAPCERCEEVVEAAPQCAEGMCGVEVYYLHQVPKDGGSAPTKAGRVRRRQCKACDGSAATQAHINVFAAVTPVPTATPPSVKEIAEAVVTDTTAAVGTTMVTTMTTTTMTTITTTVLPTPQGTEGGSDGICSTYIVCNPTQFACPNQLTHPSQLSEFFTEWDLVPGKIPGAALPADNEQLVMGSEKGPQSPDGGSDPSSPAVVPEEADSQSLPSIVDPGHVDEEQQQPPPPESRQKSPSHPPRHPSSPQKIKGIKEYTPDAGEQGKMQAATARNHANHLPGSGPSGSSLGMLLFLCAMALWNAVPLH